jgi:hypothetical protein
MLDLKKSNFIKLQGVQKQKIHLAKVFISIHILKKITQVVVESVFKLNCFGIFAEVVIKSC